MANNKIIDGKLLLKSGYMLVTGFGLALSFFGTMMKNKQEELEMREAVQKEVNRQMQLLLPMKKD